MILLQYINFVTMLLVHSPLLLILQQVTPSLETPYFWPQTKTSAEYSTSSTRIPTEEESPYSLSRLQHLCAAGPGCPQRPTLRDTAPQHTRLGTQQAPSPELLESNGKLCHVTRQSVLSLLQSLSWDSGQRSLSVRGREQRRKGKPCQDDSIGKVCHRSGHYWVKKAAVSVSRIA